jgi:hypothetical protein
MLSLGALNFLSTKTRLRRAASTGEDSPALRETSSRRIAVEGCLGALIFGASGLLSSLPPGVHAIHQAITASPSAATRALQSAEGASVRILSPQPEQIFTSGSVPLKFDLTTGKRGHHVHAYIDGQLMGMFESAQGTLNGIAPGHHTLELRVVAADHQTELAAQDRVEFIVK